VWALILEQEYTGGIIENPIISIRWGLPDRIRRDWDNLIAMTKPVIDSLTMASILVDDSVRDYIPRYGWFDSPKKPLTEIKVYRLEYDD
jgi:Holliday junction resolvase RusA-like endonuclease